MTLLEAEDIFNLTEKKNKLSLSTLVRPTKKFGKIDPPGKNHFHDFILQQSKEKQILCYAFVHIIAQRVENEKKCTLRNCIGLILSLYSK